MRMESATMTSPVGPRLIFQGLDGQQVLKKVKVPEFVIVEDVLAGRKGIVILNGQQSIAAPGRASDILSLNQGYSVDNRSYVDGGDGHSDEEAGGGFLCCPRRKKSSTENPEQSMEDPLLSDQ